MTKNKARQYKPSTVRRLDTLSGNECAAPDCDIKLIAKDGASIISKICHIEAASKKGARYNSDMTDDDRRHYDNLILLCDECHTIIDNEENEKEYPVSLLKQWKVDHEAKQKDKLSSNPSMLLKAVNFISNYDLDMTVEDESQNVNSFNISEKIEHNSILRSKFLIEEYKVYHGKISAIYQELEDAGSFKKENLLRTIRQLYLKHKGICLEKNTSIADSADDIIEAIEEELLTKLQTEEKISDEIVFGVSVIMVDAFMRCKILEEPQ